MKKSGGGMIVSPSDSGIVANKVKMKKPRGMKKGRR